MLDACLGSASELDPVPGEVIVAVDGDDPAVIESALLHGFRVVANPGAPGVSATRNAGAQAASGSILVFTDSDILLRPDHIARVASAFDEHPGVAAIIGSYDAAPSAPGIVSRYRNLLHHYTHQHGAPEAQTFWSGCGAIRREAFIGVGGFDANFRIPSVEDIELGYRLRSAGKRIRLVPSWQVKHLKKWRLRDLLVTDIGRRAIPWTKLLNREGHLDNDLNIDHASRWSAMLVWLAAIGLATGFFWPPGFLVAAVLLAIVTAMNWPFYRFLVRTGGWSFAFASVSLHWLYFAGAAAGFAAGCMLSSLGRHQESR